MSMPKRLLYAVRALPLHTVAFCLALAAAASWHPARAQADAPPCAACVLVVLDPGQALALPARLNGLEIFIRSPLEGEPAPGAHGAEIEAIRAAGGRPGLLFEVSRAAGDPDQLAFDLKTRLTTARGIAPGVRLAIAAPRDVLRDLADRDIGPYVDTIVDLQPSPLRDVSRALSAPSGGHPPAWRLPADALDARRVLIDLARAAAWLVPALVPEGTAQVRCGARTARTYLDPRTLDTIAMLDGCADQAVTVTPESPGVEQVALSNGLLLVRVPAAEGRFAEEVGVGGTRTLTVEEIVARHQAAVARRAGLIETLISTGTMTLTFEAPGFPAPIAIASEAIIYTDEARTEIEQRSIRINGLEFQGGGIPRLPIIEPERVASPPLAITLTDVYDYALAGQETIDDTPCYVVTFAPVDRSAPSVEGRAWIAADSFAMVKVSAAQTGLRGPIVSSEQVDEFRPEREGVWLLARSEVRQMYEGAAHRTPIHRVLAIARHEINPPAFRERRAAAYASASVMLRDTPEGFRYLRRDRNTGDAPSAEPAVAPRANRVRTLAAGVIVDPNISRPLPFAGLNYVDFDLFGTGSQLNGFFGGTYGQLAFSVPSLAGSRWQLAGRAFGIASSYNDRAFVGGREIYEQNIRQRPAHASVWLLRPLTPRLALRAGYELDYTHFGRGDLTAPAFVVPAHQIAHAARLALEGQRAGWNASVWWAPARRSGWARWGLPDSGPQSDYDPGHHDYQRYGVSLARPVVLTPGLVGRFEGAWMAGADLDRFSRFSFGTFDNRLRGYPSALIRYDRGGVLRLAAAWGAARLVRVDGFVDAAWVHDPGFGAGLKNYTGVGGAIEAPAPFGTLVAIEWGYGFQGVNSDGGRGTQVVRITGYKIF
jgi:hypothetical protein